MLNRKEQWTKKPEDKWGRGQWRRGAKEAEEKVGWEKVGRGQRRLNKKEAMDIGSRRLRTEGFLDREGARVRGGTW